MSRQDEAPRERAAEPGPRREDAAVLAQDRETRARALGEFAAPLLVEAGAGTGKTALLVARVLAWCLGPGWERALARAADAQGAAGEAELAARVLEGVVAITFTEDAAAEMEQRLLEALGALAEQGEAALARGGLRALPRERLALAEGVLRARAAALRDQVQLVRVRTIHAFCRQLLGEHALEAGLVPGFEVDADLERCAEAVREVLEEELPRVWSGPLAGAMATLALEGVGPVEIEAALLALAQGTTRAAELGRDPLPPEQILASLEELRGALEEFRAATCAAGSFGRSRNGPKLCAQLAQLAALAAAAGSADADLEALAQAWQRAEGEVGGELANWARAKLSGGVEEALGEAAPRACAAAGRVRSALQVLARVRPRLLRAAHALLVALLARVEALLAERGIVTFTHLLVEAARLLESRPDVAARQRARIDQLCVDEFQDTDPLQCALVRALALGGPSAQRPGLFVVGDPKQSIYAWRSADLAAYDGFARELVAAGGARGRLGLNFRSLQPVLDEVARLVAPSMEPSEGLQPPFAPLVAAREGAQTPEPPVEHWHVLEPSAQEPGAAEDVREAEGWAIAREIARLRERGVALERVGLLVRSTSELEALLEPLRRLQLPFAVSRDTSYWRRREVLEAQALVRAVLAPADTLALVAWLRSPAVGVPDAAWIALWREELPRRAAALCPGGPGGEAAATLAEAQAAVRRAAASLAGETSDAVAGLAALAGWEESLCAALAELARLRACFATRDVGRFVAALREGSALEATAAGRFLGRFRVENLEAFFAELARLLERHAADPAAVLRALRRARGDGLAHPPREEEGALRVMTIHASKGLSFQHVFLAQLDRRHQGGSRGSELLARQEGDALAFAAFGARSPLASRLAERTREVEAAERVRLLYVATTRAEDRLVLSGHAKLADARASGWRQATGFAELLAARAPALPVPAAGSDEAREPEHGLRVARVHGAPPAMRAHAAHAAEAAPAPSTPERVAADQARLARLRAEARARGARPWSVAASRVPAPGADLAPFAPVSAPDEEGSREALARPAGEPADARRAEALSLAQAEHAAALAAGRAVHRALELAGESLDAAALERVARAALAAERFDEPGAAERALALVRAALASPLVPRLVALAPRVRARELPLCAAPDPRAPEGGALECVLGAIDLVYEDEGELVVADFKTERVAPGEDLAARARAHAPQLAFYARALREALGLARAPRTELWFLAAGEVVRL